MGDLNVFTIHYPVPLTYTKCPQNYPCVGHVRFLRSDPQLNDMSGFHVTADVIFVEPPGVTF